MIKLGALGDVVQAFGPFAAISAHHRSERIVALTTAPWAALLRASPWFDEVWVDAKPAWADIPGLLALRRRLRAGGFTRVYDLQTSSRSSRYFALMGGSVEWSGIARGASHPHANPRRDSMHTVPRQQDQLRMAGIETFPPPDTAWLDAPLDPRRIPLPEGFVLLLPGASPGRPAKRWPGFADLAATLAAEGTTPVLAGTAAEAPLAAAIQERCPSARDLTGRTSLLELAAVMRRADAIIGNDSGPLHLAATIGKPSVVLFGDDSDPARCAPIGATVVRQKPIAAISTDEVRQALGRALRPFPDPSRFLLEERTR